MKVIYKGDHAEVAVQVTAQATVTAAWGEPVEVPDALGASLCESAAWMKAGKDKAAKQAADQNTDTKGAN